MIHMRYADLPKEDRYTGDHTIGEIEILPGPEQRAPVLFENKYVAIVEDCVRFPNGEEGRYMRIFHQSELVGYHGTVMLTRKHGKYVLLRVFRHPTRSWELECPRGFAEPDITAEENARREVREELGVDIEHIEKLGVVCPNTGLLTTRANVFLVELAALPYDGGADRQKEAIQSYLVLSKEEILRKIAEGEIRDAFTISSILLAIASSKF
ncbi:MAG: NUDIX hydrolase [Gammaproteobacteria bacterium]